MRQPLAPQPPRAEPPRPVPADRPQPPRRENRLPQTDPEPSALASNWTAVARGVALFFGLFTLANLAGELLTNGFDSNLWWIDLRPCPPRVARAAVGIAGVLLSLFAIRPNLPQPLRRLAISAVLLLFGAAVWNVANYYLLLRAGTLHTGLPLPFSLHVAACLAVIFGGLQSDGRFASPSPGRTFLMGLTTLVCLAGFPLAQMYCFGKTDYRRKADAIVVFGCKVNENDSPSGALHDRMRTACQLYSEGLAETLIVSGGPGEGSLHETDVMKQLAVELGVPESQIVIDREGLDTQSTVRNTVPILKDKSLARVLTVSHFYHLPRVKMCYRREGIDVFTVPAREEHRLHPLGYYLARETVALWYYYFRPVTGT